MTTGSVLAQFTITLSQAVSEQVAVEWHTTDGTALAGVDYAAAKGTVLFAPGQTAQTVDILVHGRAVGSEDRSFFVEMLPPTNAILGASIGECIIHVDTTGSTPVTQIIVTTGPQGLQGDSAYQAWLDLGNTGTEEDFINSLKPSAEEIAEEVAPILNVSNSPLTAEGTETLSKPDTMTGKRLARRVAYVGAAKVATVVLADGDNLITHAALSGDAVDFNSISLYPRILRGTVVISPEWSVEPGDKILIKSAVAGDVLHVCQYDVISERAVKNVVEPLISAANSRSFEALSRSFEALRRSLAEVGLNLVPGSFEAGATVSSANDAVMLESSGAAYVRKLGGSFNVVAGSSPDSSWVSVGSGLDDIYAFAFGLHPSASAEQNTIALCRALDIANGDYMQPVAHGNGTLARWLYGSVGTFATDPAFLTGVHAQAGKFVIRCNAQLRGRFPDAEFMIVHSRDIEVTHINAKSVEIRGAQGGDFRRWRLSGDLIIRASADRQPAWVYQWGGGTYWNEFANIRCGNTAVAGKIIFETSYGSVNANTLRRVSGQLWVTRYAGTVGSIFTECHENEIFGIDTSGSQGDPIRNDTPEGQLNTVYGWYDEVTGTGKVFGDWNIVYPKVQFNNWNTTQPEGWSIFTEPKANQQAGDFVPMTVESAGTGSDWSVIEGSKGLPYCAKGNSIAQVYTDTAEPSGSGRSWGLGAAPIGSNFKFDLEVRSSKYVRGTIWIKDTPSLSITQIRVSNSDDTNALFQSVNKYVVRSGWRLYRVVGIVDPTKAVKVDFNASGDVRFGGAMFSRSHACPLPLFPGWRKSHGIHNMQPTYLPPVSGFWFYRDSAASAADPTVAWVRVTDTGSGAYMKINATF